jgi:anti-sigma regulatory factor (Ser/Thr protein kinase)
MVDPAAADTFRHMALLYGGPKEYLLGLRAFIQAGRAGGEAILVAVPAASARWIRRELGAESAQLAFTDMTELGRNPARIIPEILGFMRKHPGRAARCVAETTWPGRSAAELHETARHEDLTNLAFREMRGTILCPYNTAGLASSVLADVERRHPFLLTGEQEVPSTRYPGSAATRPGCDGLLPAPPGHAQALGYTADLRQVRRFIGANSRHAGLEAGAAADLVLAVSELTANTLCHTCGGGTVTLWHTKHEVICQVQDSGVITDPLAGHRLPAADSPGGKGLWLVNQLCDLVQRKSTRTGTVTRLHMRLPVTET